MGENEYEKKIELLKAHFLKEWINLIRFKCYVYILSGVTAR